MGEENERGWGRGFWRGRAHDGDVPVTMQVLPSSEGMSLWESWREVMFWLIDGEADADDAVLARTKEGEEEREKEEYSSFSGEGIFAIAG